MDEQELREVLRLLEAQGWEPHPCDTELPVLTTSVSCGLPTALGDEGVEYWLPWSRELLRVYIHLIITFQLEHLGFPNETQRFSNQNTWVFQPEHRSFPSYTYRRVRLNH